MMPVQINLLRLAAKEATDQAHAAGFDCLDRHVRFKESHFNKALDESNLVLKVFTLVSYLVVNFYCMKKQ